MSTAAAQLALFAPPATPRPALPGWAAAVSPFRIDPPRVRCPRQAGIAGVVRRTDYRRDVREWWLWVEIDPPPADTAPVRKLRACDCEPA